MARETIYAGIGAAEPDAPDDGPPVHDNLWRPWWKHSGVWVLALLVLMIVGGLLLSSGAAASGGCGGG